MVGIELKIQPAGEHLIRQSVNAKESMVRREQFVFCALVFYCLARQHMTEPVADYLLYCSVGVEAEAQDVV